MKKKTGLRKRKPFKTKKKGKKKESTQGESPPRNLLENTNFSVGK